MIHSISIKCPNCGAALNGNSLDCPYCGSQVFLTSFLDITTIPIGKLDAFLDIGKRVSTNDQNALSARRSAGLCYLKLQMYDQAYAEFSEEIRQDFNRSEAYFYAAASLLRGKKAFLAQRKTILEIESLLKSAFAVEARGIYLYFLAYIRYDYYERKSLNVSPNYREFLERAHSIGTPEADIQYLYQLLGVNRPTDL